MWQLVCLRSLIYYLYYIFFTYLQNSGFFAKVADSLIKPAAPERHNVFFIEILGDKQKKVISMSSISNSKDVGVRLPNFLGVCKTISEIREVTITIFRCCFFALETVINGKGCHDNES